MPRGLPHSVFLGRPVEPGEPEWLDSDREKALAYERWRAEACPQCGTRDEEWKLDRQAYATDLERCLGCELIEMEQAQIPENQKGVKVVLLPRHAAEQRMRESDVGRSRRITGGLED